MMHPSPDQTQFALLALSVIYIAEKIWMLVAKIIAFFDKRATAKKRLHAITTKRTECARHGTHVKLPIAAGGSLPKTRLAPYRGKERVRATPQNVAQVVAQI